ncbi:MAG: glycerol dehydrogenase [Methanomassiliicoccales archaeon]
MYKKAVFPGKYVQGEGAFSELPTLLASFGRRGMILASSSVIGKVLPGSGLVPSEHDILVEPFQGECCEEELTRLADLIKDKHIDVLVGMGGGKTIDTAKIAADRARIPVIIVPTIASTDAPTSGCAVLYTKVGVFDSVLYQRTNPAAVLVDTSIIAKAPTRFLVAGMGDALSTWFEARSCDRTRSPNECGGLSTVAGLHIARLCYDMLLAYGVQAKKACEEHIVTPALEHIVEANILLSGLGFESAGLASAHSIHNGLTALEETHQYYHGEKVAFGVLAGLHLSETSREEMETVYSFCEDVGLPTTLADIGLDNLSRERLMIAAERACAPGQPIHHEEGTITPEKVLEAMLSADAMGRDRMKRGKKKV